MAVTSSSVTLTVVPPCTALSSVTLNSSPPPSVRLTSSIDSAASSLSVSVPVAVSLSVTRVLNELRLTSNVSVASTTASSSESTVKVWISPAVPANTRSATTLS